MISDDSKCPRCGGQMAHAFTGHIQLGRTSLLCGDWPNLLAGSMPAHVFCCKECGRLEFFAVRDEVPEIPQATCPVCGKSHDFDWPRCPFCKHEY